MAPLSTKESKKRALPTSPTSQAPFRNDTKRYKPDLRDNNEITYVHQTHTDQQCSFRDDQMVADRHQLDLLKGGDFSFAAAAFEDHAAENTRKIIDAIKSIQPRQQHHTSWEQSRQNPDIAQQGLTAVTAETGLGAEQQIATSQMGGRRFVLTVEDSSFVRDYFQRVTPRGESPPDMQSITDLMESGNDEEDAKRFLDKLDASMKQRCPPKSQSLVRMRQNPFIRDISRLHGPIYNYCQDNYLLGTGT